MRSLEDVATQDLRRWRSDPVAFVREVLVNPEDGLPFALYGAQERFLRRALTLTPGGRLPFPETLYSAPKKSGKTATAAMSMIYTVLILGGRFAEGYCAANDFEQAQGRVFQACARMIEASPMLAPAAKITANRIEFPARGSFIQAIATDYAGAAGSNPTITCFDELWAYTSERSQRLWDESVPPPTRKVATRLTVTYAGFEDESTLLEGLYRRAMGGQEVAPGLFEAPGLLAFWSHIPVAPWQTEEWLEQMRYQLRPNAYLRMIENRWVSSEAAFVDMDDWDGCVDPTLSPVIEDRKLPVFVGVDASVKRDHTAIVTVTYDAREKKVRLVAHRTFKPSPSDPLDFERTIEEEVLGLHQRFNVRAVRFDPYQMVSSAQRLQRAGVPMEEFPQTGERLERMGTNLYDLVGGRNLVTYPNLELRLAVSRAVAKETARGWRIAKEKASHKIDLVVALAMAAFAAVDEGAKDEDRRRRREALFKIDLAELNAGFTRTSPWRAGGDGDDPAAKSRCARCGKLGSVCGYRCQ